MWRRRIVPWLALLVPACGHEALDPGTGSPGQGGQPPVQDPSPPDPMIPDPVIPDPPFVLPPLPDPGLTICQLAGRRVPVRPLRVAGTIIAERLDAFIVRDGAQGSPSFAAGQSPPPGTWITSADVERAVRNWFGSTDAANLRLHTVGLLSFFSPLFSLSNGDTSNYLTLAQEALIAGPGGVQKLVAGPWGPEQEGRVGIFSDPVVLSLYPRAPSRGRMLRSRFLCQEMPPLPPSIVISPPPVLPGQTYRQMMEATVLTQAPCGACHSYMTLLGFAFENFDRAGGYQTLDNGQPIDASGTVIDLDQSDQNVDFAGPAEGMAAIAGSCAVRRCLARLWLGHALGTFGKKLDDVDEVVVSNVVDELASALVASGDNLLELVIALTQSELFLAP